MKVFKFGGASVKNAEAIQNVANILKTYNDEKVVVVVSAMAKTTNALEVVWRQICQGNPFDEELNDVKEFHYSILKELNLDDDRLLKVEFSKLFDQIDSVTRDRRREDKDYLYDQIVSKGELFSTLIISRYLESVGVLNKWYDARELIKTDYNFREAKIDWTRTEVNLKGQLIPYFEKGNGNIAITQGFLGGADSLNTTTLGREGSDYSASILAFGLNAEEVIIWKDVPGVLNADPRYFPDAVKLDQISFKEAIELAYYGASVIHPKTIQPLQNKSIPLRVKSFVDPSLTGTLISSDLKYDGEIPSFIFKNDQKLISISTKDFAFIVEENLKEIFDVFTKHKVKINIMQNSAINFSVAVDNGDERTIGLIEELKHRYKVLYNEGLTLVTIRHYDDETIGKLTHNSNVLLEQRTRQTYRGLIKKLEN